ncbi:MAG: D-alanyl-D-alanine carboxypeptidase/D-alanyl-D-alanine-endopeptidase [Gemmatimonadaceae bacterium]|nr:D-alanyl-D-alanine carboxypeptidase/D-alanyl-D-alanine-endopeptidase [Gemmatimonadaceae bacterium]
MPRLRCLLTAPVLLLAGCSSRSVPVAATAPAPAAIPSPVAAPVPAAPVPAAPPSPSAPFLLQPFVDSLVALPQFANAHWGILVVAPQRGDTLASVHADRLVMPASNQKLLTAAVALATLGPGYQWRTTFTRTGPIVRGELRGDLVVTGTGDPSISTALRGAALGGFDPLVAALRTAGVRHITGRVRPSPTQAFPGSPHGYGWDWDDLAEDYGAGVTELLFNEGFTEVHVTGCARPGRAACVVTAPARTTPVLRSTVTVRAAGSGAPHVEWWRDSAAVPGIALRGSIAAGDSLAFTAAQPDDRVTYVAAVTEALTRAGITVRGRGAARRQDVGPDTVVVLRSLPLSAVLPAMQKLSQNQLAEVLYRTLGLEVTGSGTPDSARRVVERQLDAWGVRPDGRVVRDGSGLSRHDYVTPRTILQVLDTMRRSSTFAVYRDALPVAGQDGTLRNRMRGVAQGRVQAKTGTIDKARALSGYVTTADGELLLISLIANNFTVPNREIDRIQDLLLERLVTLRRSAP